MSGKISPHIVVVVAAFNEAPVIGRVLDAIKRAGYDIIVVDDGSSDGTGDIAEAYATVLRHPGNLGQGAGLQTGIEYALAGGAEVIVTFDADEQHRVEDISSLANALREHQVDFALGSRFLGSAPNLRISRRLMLKAAMWFTRLTTGLRITDAHNGVRAMTRRGAKAIRLRQNRMAHASEILDQLARSGLDYVEVPVTIDYHPYSLKKGQRISDSLLILIDLLARKLQR